MRKGVVCVVIVLLITMVWEVARCSVVVFVHVHYMASQICSNILSA